MNHKRWDIKPVAPTDYLVPSAFPPIITQLLYNRGLSDQSQVDTFISADRRLVNDPFLLPYMSQAVSRIYKALFSGELIAIYGDFDADGITGTALLVEGLHQLGAQTTTYIPHRFNEGHGLKKTVLESLHRQGHSLVITVDCGITGVAQVQYAQKIGLDIIITDHHTPLDNLPPAAALIDPKLPSSTYPDPELAGVGVAYKLLQALFEGMGRGNQLDNLIDLVALGTVADMMPVTGENRYLIKQGLKLINNRPRLGLKEMIKQAQLTEGRISAEDISWVIAPRLNAASRMDHAIPGLELLMTDSQVKAHKLSAWLEEKNSQRQKMTTKVWTEARNDIISEYTSPLLITGSKEYFIGVAGLVASRLANEFYRPAIIIKIGDRVCNGSCRSIPEFNIISALNECRHLLTDYGGHAQAAGFSLPTKNLTNFKQHIKQFASRELAEFNLRPHIEIDMVVSLPELDSFTLQSIQNLAPFGANNPKPTFLSHGVEIMDCQTMGNNKEHLKMKLQQGGAIWDAVGFRLGDYFLKLESPVNVVYTVDSNLWAGTERYRLSIIDINSS